MTHAASITNAAEWMKGAALGDRRALSRFCRLLDDLSALDSAARSEVLRALYSEVAPRGTWTLGITGSPGAGKSTLVSALLHQLRALGKRCAVLAIDPTSPFSGGALLGDRIRMQDHFQDPEVFIRSLATRGAHGGLSRSTADQLRALRLWGAEVILVETVGVGQDETDVAAVADTTCVVLTPGMGDDVQANKAGILETADVFAVNKSDRPGAERVVSDLQSMLALGRITRGADAGPIFGARHSGAGALPQRSSTGEGAEYWEPPIVQCSASLGQGIAELMAALTQHRDWLNNTDAGRERLVERRLRSARTQVLAAVVDVLRRDHGASLDELSHAVAAGRLDAHSATTQLIAVLGSSAGVVTDRT
ncbi:MAG: hypothetical protein RJA70_2386 [Pseudomonadota bacterium]|jgi:LAO/AO transport system kinase